MTFGLYNKTTSYLEAFGNYYSAVKVNYPNYLKSLNIRKINGQLNTYTLVMEYPITPNDDPNMIDKILSRVSSSRKIVFTYGDSTVPGFMYRNEEAIITQVNSTPDVASSKITYTISATSTAVGLNANTFSFPRVFDKPSNQIRALLKDRSKGLLDIFYGMHDPLVVDSLNLIESEDKEVEIPAQTNMSVLDYLKYLVSCMIASSDSSQGIFKSNRYVITFYDGVSE